jgi:hypothetical protein
MEVEGSSITAVMAGDCECDRAPDIVCAISIQTTFIRDPAKHAKSAHLPSAFISAKQSSIDSALT